MTTRALHRLRLFGDRGVLHAAAVATAACALTAGLVYVGYPGLERVPKDSAAWYAGVIRRGGPGVVHTLPS